MRSICVTVCVGLLAAGSAKSDDAIAKEMLAGQLKVIADTAASDPVILRLDSELELLVNRAKKLGPRESVDFLAAGLSPQKRLYATFGMPDTQEFSKFLLGMAKYPKVDLHREAFADRDLSKEIEQAYQKCSKAFGRPLDKAPLYKVAFGYQRTTNAQMQGIDQRLGRNIVVLNRSALAPGRLWDAAIIHETWHCFQPSRGFKRTLQDRAFHEGVVTHLTQIVDPTLADHTVMLWSKAEWEAAWKRRDAIAKAFAEDRTSKEQEVMKSYMILGKPLGKVRGAPSRCGYFVGLLAARAWSEANPKKGPADLIKASADEIWAAFEKR